MNFEEVFSDFYFYVLMGIGYAAFGMMSIILKGMDEGSFLPIWVKIAVIVAVPIGAALFRVMFSSD